MILIIDNYDSFTYNLAQYVGSVRPSGDAEVVDNTSQISQNNVSPKTEVQVLRNDDERLYEVAEKANALIFSPGPGWPADAGKMEQMIHDFAGRKPILGVCLGFQAIVESFGGKLRLARTVMHGKASTIRQTSGNTLFENLPNHFRVMRYHSIVMDENVVLPDFAITALSIDDREVMAIENEKLKIYGLQFHPESIGTLDGMTMIENFVRTVNENE